MLMLLIVCWSFELLGAALALEPDIRVYFFVMFIEDLGPVAYPSAEGAFHGFWLARRPGLCHLLSACFAGTSHAYLSLRCDTGVGWPGGALGGFAGRIMGCWSPAGASSSIFGPFRELSYLEPDDPRGWAGSLFGWALE